MEPVEDTVGTLPAGIDAQDEGVIEPPSSSHEPSEPVESIHTVKETLQAHTSSSIIQDAPSDAVEDIRLDAPMATIIPEQNLPEDQPSPSHVEYAHLDDQSPPARSIPESLTETEIQLDAEPLTETETEPVAEPESAEERQHLITAETSKQRRKREAEERRHQEEQEEREQKEFEQYRIDQERMEMARLEQKRLERERARQERREKERIEQEKLEKERAEQERLEKIRLEEVRVEEERLEQKRIERDRVEKERIEQERIDQERLERARLEQERLDAQKRDEERLEKDRIEREEAERARLEQERHDAQRRVEERIQLARRKIESEAAEQTRLQQEPEAAAMATAPVKIEALNAAVPQARDDMGLPSDRSVAAEPPQGSMPPPGLVPEHATASSVATINAVNRLPTPVPSMDRSNSLRSVTTDAPRSRAQAPEPAPPSLPLHRSEEVDQLLHSKRTAASPALPAPKPQAVSQLIEDNRPPAPSPPVARARPRHVPAFDSEDESDTALVRPRRQFRGGEDYTRDSSGSTREGYPPPTHHAPHRSVFASRVPPEQYANPPPPQNQPPGYHPGYYPPTAPPHYQNHNYRMSQQGYPHPNAYGPPSHSSSSPYTETWNYPPGYRHDSPPQRHDALVTRDYPSGLAPLDTRSALGGDPGDVFSRIAQTLPDLHVLLAQYKETHSQLSAREELLRRTSAEQEEKLRVKDTEIAELKDITRDWEHKYSTVASRLRLQTSNLEEQARELREQRAEIEKFRTEAQDTKTALDRAMKSWEGRYRELEEAHAVLKKTSAEEKAKAYQDFDEWRSTYTTRNDAEKIALAIQFDKRLKEADTLAQEAAAASVKEKEELRADHQRQQLERQASFERVRNELETKLGAAQIDREEALKQQRESRELWLAEREALMRAHQDDRESIRKGWDEQRDLLEAQHRKSRDESDKAWIELHADATKKADEQKTIIDQLIKEKEDLYKRHNALKAESEQEKAIIKSVATNLESEKSRLEKLMECYGDIAEIKSKGDTY